jgi:hypothetical protein
MNDSRLMLAIVMGAICGCSEGPEMTASNADGNAIDAIPADTTIPAGESGRSEPFAEDELVDRALIDSCAGFDAEKAASLLGVNAAELEVLESFSERFGGQTCRYWSAASNIGPGIDILLNVQESSDAATRVLANQRELMPRVEAVPPTGPALVEFDFGDEAIWDTNTGGVNVRVRNVIATVHVSMTDQPVSDRDAEQIELERRIAEEVAAVLQP